jgi:hypothetical protein
MTSDKWCYSSLYPKTDAIYKSPTFQSLGSTNVVGFGVQGRFRGKWVELVNWLGVRGSVTIDQGRHLGCRGHGRMGGQESYRLGISLGIFVGSSVSVSGIPLWPLFLWTWWSDELWKGMFFCQALPGFLCFSVLWWCCNFSPFLVPNASWFLVFSRPWVCCKIASVHRHDGTVIFFLGLVLSGRVLSALRVASHLQGKAV